MPRTFAYARVSTAGQTPENQTREIATAGFDIPAYRQATEVISGGVPAMHRPGFAKLVVTNFGRLGRNAMDVEATIKCWPTSR